MTRTLTKRRQYGKQSKKTKAEQLFAELPQTPEARRAARARLIDDDDDDDDNDGDYEDEEVGHLTSQLHEFTIEDGEPRRQSARLAAKESSLIDYSGQTLRLSQDDELENHDQDAQTVAKEIGEDEAEEVNATRTTIEIQIRQKPEVFNDDDDDGGGGVKSFSGDDLGKEPVEEVASDKEPQGEEPSLRVLTWEDVCPFGDTITKIAEASYAEVYRVTNERGVSIIKVIRIQSPIKAQTKTQVKSGLVDEEPHSEDDLDGELRISEWLADIPGFVVYKERYIVQGKTTKQLLETHQAFQKKMKKEDPGRAQYYPSPSRYLDDTKFMVVELGDAGTALEDWALVNENQLWDIFLLEAIALARAEDIAMFEHRDLHEGNLCIKQVRPPRDRNPKTAGYFGYSGLDITILDYGLSRAEDLSIDDATPVAFDLEKDLSLFTSTHAPQCKVYRQMRSFLLRADRKCLPPEAHSTPYAKGVDGPLDWKAFAPYTNVLWLAYLYEYMIEHFQGGKRELNRFKKETAELWTYLNPDAPDEVPCFGCAGDVVGFALEAGWVREDQLQGVADGSFVREESIIMSRDEGKGTTRRSARRRG
ncbi:putative serine/threonine-protein kinase haspin -like protein [Escovopsis weberi]|uniref:non-specific serine/threonine protein kinase n=1 Tax=Escovopsis weberi TaxID=150374 RepID=A0A0N0RSY9_ESCWE|nr:putative serine/threonine-protein kinase haspin -like protein [Escovopsis weberi]